MQGAVNSSSDSLMVGLMYHIEASAVKNDELQAEQEVRTLKLLSLVEMENELAILVAMLLFATVAADATYFDNKCMTECTYIHFMCILILLVVVESGVWLHVK